MSLHDKQKEGLSKSQLYYIANRDVILLRSKENYIKNKEGKIRYSIEYQNKNKEKKKQWSKKYRDSEAGKIKRAIWIENNKEHIRATLMKRQKERETVDINHKLSNRLRHRLYLAIKNKSKAGSAVGDLGCTIDELKRWLESRFIDGMSWENWTIDGWHIDHIIPISSFDLSSPDELKAACHYTNLQPLWALDNIRKNASSF